jgi:hypothetical protein
MCTYFANQHGLTNDLKREAMKDINPNFPHILMASHFLGDQAGVTLMGQQPRKLAVNFFANVRMKAEILANKGVGSLDRHT